jgi:hypothetical protein
MPIDAPGNQPLPRPVRPAGPIISASRGQVFITGSGFLPNYPVIVRITYSDEDIVDYLTCISDADGFLSAPLPETAASETAHIAAADQRPDPAGDGPCCGATPSSLPLPAREIQHGGFAPARSPATTRTASLSPTRRQRGAAVARKQR